MVESTVAQSVRGLQHEAYVPQLQGCKDMGRSKATTRKAAKGLFAAARTRAVHCPGDTVIMNDGDDGDFVYT